MAKTKTKVKAAPKFGVAINKLFNRREKIRKLEAQLNELKDLQREEEMELRTALLAAGTDTARSAKATVTVGTREVASIENYQKFEQFVLKHGALDLLQKRVAVTALRERRENGEKIPGLHVEHLPTLNMRVRSK